MLPHEALALDPAELGSFDLVVVVGNVMIYLGEGTERSVLERVRDLLAPDGRVLLGFHLTAVKSGSRTYPADEFVADVEASGLRVVHRFGSYELHEPVDDYAVWVLARGLSPSLRASRTRRRSGCRRRGRASAAAAACAPA